MKILIELKPGFQEDQLKPLKDILSTYFDAYIAEMNRPTSSNPITDRNVSDNGMKFNIQFDVE